MLDPISGLTAGTCAASFLIDPFVDSRTEVPVVYAMQDEGDAQDRMDIRSDTGVAWLDPTVIEITARTIDPELYYPNAQERRILREALEATSERISEGFLVE